MGSDNKTACASCHFHAGADVRTRNQLGIPQLADGMSLRAANAQLTSEAFPFRQLTDPFDRESELLRDTREVVGSAGLVAADFSGVVPGTGQERRNRRFGRDFAWRNVPVRTVTTRNAPSVINSVFNHRQNYDGRARSTFNGVDEFGERNRSARVFEWYGGTDSLQPTSVRINSASLASAAIGMANGPHAAMSYRGRTFAELGQKLLGLQPLVQQEISETDSVLAPLKAAGRSVRYSTLVRRAFHRRWWGASDIVGGEFTQMEANFSLYFGLAIQAYLSTLVSDDAPFDRWVQGDGSALSGQQLRGLRDFFGAGRCFECHRGPEFGGGTVREIDDEHNGSVVGTAEMAAGGIAWYDVGYFNIGLRPADDDPGLGSVDRFGPLSEAWFRQEAGSRSIKPGDWIAADGAHRAPSLRNVELTGPYFHNGSRKSLEEVIAFYARGGDFDNLDSRSVHIEPIRELQNAPARVEAIAAFLLSLTDDRVRYRKAPFDHPALLINEGHGGVDPRYQHALDRSFWLPATGREGSEKPLQTFEAILRAGDLQSVLESADDGGAR